MFTEPPGADQLVFYWMTVVLGIPVGLGGQSNRLCVGGREAGEGKARRSSHRADSRHRLFPCAVSINRDGRVFQYNLRFRSVLENSLFFIHGSTILNFITCSNLICITPKIARGQVALEEGDGDMIALLEKAPAGGSPAGL